ncbi:hypothetical protein E2C01_077065 [Portunus trituberculatus]|uniref:Uncharacterized protein n=1 Tax=Portunus trituberculatus TaxID=210409 RepID=A0A5B7INJ6_PORTR|nr:hypothetical protein [Portunus trituberculatus]
MAGGCLDGEGNALQGRGEEGKGVMENCLDRSLEMMGVMGAVTRKIDDPCRIKWKVMLLRRCYN